MLASGNLRINQVGILLWARFVELLTKAGPFIGTVALKTRGRRVDW